MVSKLSTHTTQIRLTQKVTQGLINFLKIVSYRAVARSENPGGHVVLGGDNVPPPLVEIGLTDLPKSGGTCPQVCPAQETERLFLFNLSNKQCFTNFNV